MDTVFDSVFASIDAFVYRCRNDKDYTMTHMSDGVTRLTGHQPAQIIGNAKRSYYDLVEGTEGRVVFGQVNAAIEAGQSWDVAYRLIHRAGHAVDVRERGRAVFEDGELSCLEGLVVGAEAEVALRDQMHSRAEHTRTASVDIVKLTQRITSSVRELSMLSVNARIEAARSGEAGVGFAQVANEMKTLAERNAVWADDIVEQVGRMTAR